MAKRHSPLLLILLALCMLSSCTKNEFTLEFEFPEDVNSNYKLMVAAISDKQNMLLELPVAISQGKFTIKVPCAHPTFAYLYTSSGTKPVLAFYAERGDKITISGSGTDPLAWDIKGNELDEKWTAWRHDNLKSLHEMAATGRNDAVAAYVKKNPDDEFSLLLLLEEYSRAFGDEDEKYGKLLESLGEKGKSQKLLRAALRADQTDFLLPADASLNRLVLYTVGDTMATLDASKAPVTLLYIWRSTSARRRVVMDSLLKLQDMARYKGKLQIADISMDRDTLAWKRSLRADSAARWLRAFVPAGEMHPSVASLAITEVPQIILSDKKGKIIYRGSDYAQARRVMDRALNL